MENTEFEFLCIYFLKVTEFKEKREIFIKKINVCEEKFDDFCLYLVMCVIENVYVYWSVNMER